MPNPTTPPKTASPRDQGVLAALLVMAVIAFNIWTVESVTPSAVRLWGAEKQIDYSNLTLDGFQAGHLYLKVTPPPALVNAENPYDPAKRPAGVALADMSYYKGRYYSYFGVAPVVTLFLPWRVITGHDLPAPFAALFFVNGAFLASVALLWGLRRRYFPESGTLALAIGILSLGLASMTYAVLRRTSIWEPPVAAGYFFSTASLFCLFRGIHSRRLLAWFAAAGLLMGLAAGSRPTLVVGAAAFAAPIAWAWFNRSGSGKEHPVHSWWRQSLALGIPFGFVLAGLFAYNFERFGNPLEFGLNYQLTQTYEAAVRHFSTSYVSFNAYVYYLAPAQWSRYFPFVRPVHLPKLPPGYYTSEYAYGILSNVPLSWLAVLAPLALVRRPPDERGRFSALLGSIAAYYAGVGLFLLCFVTSTARYVVDFAPTLILLACIGLLALERLAPRGCARSVVLALAAALAAVSVAVCMLLNVQLLNLVRQLNPALYRGLSHAFDTPVALLEGQHGTRFGPLEMKVRFPADKIGGIEPLIATGWEFEADYLIINYVDALHVRLGFEHTGFPIRWGEPISVDYQADHVIRASLGSLFPPRDHPFFDHMDSVQYAALCRWLTVSVDGNTVLDQPQEFYDGSPGSLWIGREPNGAYGSLFTGVIRNVSHLPNSATPAPTVPQGPVKIVLPIPAADTARQVPLLITGEFKHADSLFLRIEKPGIVRFYYEHGDGGLICSGDVDLDTRTPHTLVVSTPALWSDDAGADPFLKGRLFLKLDERIVAFQEVPSFGPRRGAMYFGANAGISRYSEREYPWPIRSVRPVAAGTLPQAGSVKEWAAPLEQVNFRQDLPAERTGNGGSLALSASICTWIVLFVWVSGRIAGVDWAGTLMPYGRAASRPVALTFSWVGSHKVLSACVTIAALAMACGIRLREDYLRAAGPVRLRIQLPLGYWDRGQTLLATGTSGAGANYFVAYTDRTHIQMGADIWGANYVSKPVSVDYSVPQDVVINASGLYPRDHPRVRAIPADLLERLRNTTLVALNGKTVLLEPRSAYDSSVSEVTLGETKVGFSNSEHVFKGQILKVERLPIAREFRVGRDLAAHLTFRLDSSVVDSAQPLLSIGSGGRQGLCYVKSVAAPYFHVGFVGPDGAWTETAKFRDSPGMVHELEVIPGYVVTAPPRSAVKLTLDGVQVSSPKGFVAYDDCTVASGFSPGAVAGVCPIFLGPQLDASLAPASRPSEPDPSQAPLLLVVKFSSGQVGAEPLLVTGVTGAGDLIYVQYADEGRVRFGFDHWGVGGKLGELMPIDFRLPHRLEVDTGALRHPEGSIKPSLVRIVLDGSVVLEGMSGSYPVGSKGLSIGANPIGGSTCEPAFHGDILSARRR